MSVPVLSDAQMGMFQVLRPMPNFEAVYQGQAGTIPIAFPGTLAPQAGREGYSGELLAGLVVPLGSRLLVQIPMTITDLGDGGDPQALARYAYQFIWRTRNQSDVAEALLTGKSASPYHIPSEPVGRKLSPAASRGLIFIPAASDVEIFEQAEPSSGAALLNVRQQRYVPQITQSWVQPLTPSGAAGVWQQGAYQYTSFPEPSGPSWVPLWLDCSGDEMMILAYKLNADEPWDFEDADECFSNTYGTNHSLIQENENIGILVSSGTMGS